MRVEVLWAWCLQLEQVAQVGRESVAALEPGRTARGGPAAHERHRPVPHQAAPAHCRRQVREGQAERGTFKNILHVRSQLYIVREHVRTGTFCKCPNIMPAVLQSERFIDANACTNL